MTSELAIHPPVTWAQRNELVFLTVFIDDVKDPEIKVEGNKLHVKGIGGPDKKTFEADLELYKEINPETSKQLISGRCLEFVLMKSEPGPYWPRLLKDSKKCHWLKVDFNRWKDEDESDDEGAGDGPAPGGMDLDAMMKQMGGLGGGAGGMPDLGMGAMEGDDKEEEEEDSDDGDLPDLEA